MKRCLMVACLTIAFSTAASAATPTEPPSASIGDEHVETTAYGPGPAEYLHSDSMSGCWEDHDTWGGYYGGWDCVTVKLALTRNGRTINTDDFWDRALTESAAGKLVRWSCSAPGDYAWTITYTNSSFTNPDGTPYSQSASGNFVVPECRPTKPKRVDRATAKAAAIDLGKAVYRRQTTSAASCNSVSKRVPASAWNCTVVHNDLSTECRDRFRVMFVGRDGWGRPIFYWHYDPLGRIGCRSF